MIMLMNAITMSCVNDVILLLFAEKCVCLSFCRRPGMLQSPSLVQRALLSRNNRRAKETGRPPPPPPTLFVFFNYVIAVFSTLDIHLTVRTRSVDPVSVTSHDLREDSPRRRGRDYWVIKMLSLKHSSTLAKRQIRRDPMFRSAILYLPRQD